MKIREVLSTSSWNSVQLDAVWADMGVEDRLLPRACQTPPSDRLIYQIVVSVAWGSPY